MRRNSPPDPAAQEPQEAPTSTRLLDIDRLHASFGSGGSTVLAVDDLSVSIDKGRTLGLVGESGSGKSTTAYSIIGLLPADTARMDAKRISLLGQDLVRLPPKRLQSIRGNDISMIFQEPQTALNPIQKVGHQVAEAIRAHTGATRSQAQQRTITLFDEVGLPDPQRRINSYPHELSGGQKQRVLIAMALSCDPQLLIADEPTTALDVSVQAQILTLIRRLRDERGMGILFVTHDLGVIAEIADDVAVMFRGKMVEYGPVLQVFEHPQHPYTRGLLACRPRLDSPARRLPTVADFMATSGDDDQTTEVHRIAVTDQRLRELTTRGRGRLLSPASQLESMAHPFGSFPTPADTQVLPQDATPLLSVRDLVVEFKTPGAQRGGGRIRAVDQISFDVYPGQTLGLVGESGCGKSTTGRAILRLGPVTSGNIRFDQTDLTRLPESKVRPLRSRMQMIFQDPYGSLNPRMTVGSLLAELVAKRHPADPKHQVRARIDSLIRDVGLAPEHLRRYPRQFSGGQRQRISIARALALEPDFIICDEAVSALDVSVQAQVLNLLKDLQEQHGLTYIFISHDLSVVKFMSDMMIVMKQGKIVEQGPSEAIYANPADPYTRELINAIPDDSIENIRRLQKGRSTPQRAPVGENGSPGRSAGR